MNLVMLHCKKCSFRGSKKESKDHLKHILLKLKFYDFYIF